MRTVLISSLKGRIDELGSIYEEYLPDTHYIYMGNYLYNEHLTDEERTRALEFISTFAEMNSSGKHTFVVGKYDIIMYYYLQLKLHSSTENIRNRYKYNKTLIKDFDAVDLLDDNTIQNLVYSYGRMHNYVSFKNYVIATSGVNIIDNSIYINDSSIINDSFDIKIGDKQYKLNDILHNPMLINNVNRKIIIENDHIRELSSYNKYKFNFGLYKASDNLLIISSYPKVREFTLESELPYVSII